MKPTCNGLYWVAGYGLAIVGEFTDPQNGGESRWLICTRTGHIPLGDRRAWLICSEDGSVALVGWWARCMDRMWRRSKRSKEGE